MGLDITFTAEAPEFCPHCGKITEWKTIEEEFAYGRQWYKFLDEIGYTDKDEQDDYKWYGKDMVLTAKQVERLAKLVHNADYCSVRSVVAEYFLTENCRIVVNADW